MFVDELDDLLKAGLFALDSQQDQEELNHLQRNSDAPIHVPVDDGGLVNLHPIIRMYM